MKMAEAFAKKRNNLLKSTFFYEWVVNFSTYFLLIINKFLYFFYLLVIHVLIHEIGLVGCLSKGIWVFELVLGREYRWLWWTCVVSNLQSWMTSPLMYGLRQPCHLFQPPTTISSLTSPTLHPQIRAPIPIFLPNKHNFALWSRGASSRRQHHHIGPCAALMLLIGVF